jgi:purine-nucleoside phosphorylase
MVQQLNETLAFLKAYKITRPEIGIVLGTGLGQMVNNIDVEQEIAYSDIPNFCLSTVETHVGKLIYGNLQGKKVLAMQGRFHYYEGYSMQQITFPIKIMKMLGVQFLLLSNASGGMRADLKKGALVLLEDHINLLPDNPLFGKNIDSLGPRFPDMSRPYAPILREHFISAASSIGIDLKEGVYVAVSGPNLETRAEYRFLKMIGGDIVGMSTVPEVIVANQIGLPCAAVSVVTDECDPDNLKPVDIAEIIATANAADTHLTALFTEVIKNL